MRQWVINGVSGLTLNRPLFLGKRGDDYEQEDDSRFPGILPPVRIRQLPDAPPILRPW
jgi:hypothetical protein